MTDQEKIYELQAALRTCLIVLYDVEDVRLESSRIIAVDQAHKALDVSCLCFSKNLEPKKKSGHVFGIGQPATQGMIFCLL